MYSLESLISMLILHSTQSWSLSFVWVYLHAVFACLILVAFYTIWLYFWLSVLPIEPLSRGCTYMLSLHVLYLWHFVLYGYTSGFLCYTIITIMWVYLHTVFACLILVAFYTIWLYFWLSVLYNYHYYVGVLTYCLCMSYTCGILYYMVILMAFCAIQLSLSCECNYYMLILYMYLWLSIYSIVFRLECYISPCQYLHMFVMYV